MKSGNNENEHHRNLANFDVLIVKLVNLGQKYKPIRTAIHISALKIISQNARNALSQVDTLQEKFTGVFLAREKLFIKQSLLIEELKSYILSITSMTELELYLVSGCRYMPLGNLEKNARHDYLLKNWSKLIHVIKTLAHYHPKNTDMQLTNLEHFYSSWYAKHQEVKILEAYLHQSQTVLEEVFYRNRYGLVAIAGIVKMYIKYQFGWNSLIHKQIVGLSIKNHQWDFKPQSRVAEK